MLDVKQTSRGGRAGADEQYRDESDPLIGEIVFRNGEAFAPFVRDKLWRIKTVY